MSVPLNGGGEGVDRKADGRQTDRFIRPEWQSLSWKGTPHDKIKKVPSGLQKKRCWSLSMSDFADMKVVVYIHVVPNCSRISKFASEAGKLLCCRLNRVNMHRYNNLLEWTYRCTVQV